MTASWTIEIQTVSLLFWHYAAVFLRVAAFSSLLPAVGERTVPMRVKLAIAFALTLVAAPVVSDSAISGTSRGWVALIFSETLVGLGLGILVRFFVFCLQIAGTIAAQAMSLSQLLGGTGEPVPAMGQVLVTAGLAAAVTAGLHVRAVEFLVLSYQVFAPGLWPDAAILSEWSVAHLSRIFILAFVLAAPFVIISLLYNLTLGVINRAMPQLMVAFVGAPAITLAGIGLLALIAPVSLAVWLAALLEFTSAPPGLAP